MWYPTAVPSTQAGYQRGTVYASKHVAVQSLGFWVFGSDEGGERAAVLVGGEELGEVGVEGAVL